MMEFQLNKGLILGELHDESFVITGDYHMCYTRSHSC